jgi:hypothetical protein
MRTGFKLGTFLSLCITALMASCGSDEAAPATCGNGIAEEGEVCDGPDLKGATCAAVCMNAAAQGSPRCAPNCAFDLTVCACGGGQGGQGATGP